MSPGVEWLPTVERVMFGWVSWREGVERRKWKLENRRRNQDRYPIA